MEELLSELEKTAKDVNYGQAVLTLSVHSGKIVGLLKNSLKRRLYKQDGAIEAMQEIVEKIKTTREQKQSGLLTFTIGFVNGEIRELILSENEKVVLTNVDK
jgi:signal recognition particle GTPase